MLPDTTQCPDAIRAYRAWDQEIKDELYLERVEQEVVKEFFNNHRTGVSAIFNLYADGLLDTPDDNARLDLLLYLAVCTFHGPLNGRVGAQTLMLELSSTMAERLFSELVKWFRKEAERRIEKERDYF